MRNVIFDWDGTLIKTLDLWMRGYQVSLERRGYRFDPKSIVKEFFYNHHEVPDRHPGMDFQAIVDETREHVLNGLSSVELYDGVPEVLNELKQDKKMLTLVSSSARHILLWALRAHGLEHYFNSVISGDDGFGHKPNTLPFEKTLERIRGIASETLVIGDTHVDIQAGRASGCQTCLFAPEHSRLFHDFDNLKAMSPDHEVFDIRAIVEIT